MVHRFSSFGKSIPIGRFQDVAKYPLAPYWQPSILHVSETPGAELQLIFFEKLSSWECRHTITILGTDLHADDNINANLSFMFDYHKAASNMKKSDD